MPLNDQPFVRKGTRVYFERANDTPGDGPCLGEVEQVMEWMANFLEQHDFGEDA